MLLLQLGKFFRSGYVIQVNHNEKTTILYPVKYMCSGNRVY